MAKTSAVVQFIHPQSQAAERSAPALDRVEVFHGANVYHRSSVARRRLHLGDCEGLHTAELGADFKSRFLARFLTLKTILAFSPIREPVVARLSTNEGIPLEAALLEAIRAVETAILAAAHRLDSVDFTALARGGDDEIFLIWETHSSRFSRAASDTAFAGLMELLPSDMRPPIETSFEEALNAALTKAKKQRLSPTSAVLMRAAKRRGYPIESMTGQHLRLGEGARQHQIYASMTGLTSISAAKLAADKRQTHRRLQKLRLPVPDQIRVESSTEARQALLDLGGAVVVKPQRGSRGGGVTAGVECADDMDIAFDKAAEIAQRAAKGGSGVIVERFLPGTDHRLLVVGGQFLAALIRVPPSITGDGIRTARELINELNTDPYRDGFRLFHVDIDDTALKLLRDRGYELDDVVSRNEDVPLRSASNVSSGGIPIDVTDRVHPDNRQMAEMAAEGIGLDVAGVDFICDDISRSYRDTGGGIVEVNARPGLCMHTWPRRGKPRNVADKVLDLVCPKGDGGVVPKLLIAGDRGLGTVASAAGHLLRCAGFAVGEATSQSRAPNDKPLETDKSNRRQALRQLLHDPKLDALVSTTSMNRLLGRGLVLTNVDAVAILPPTDKSRHWVYAKGIEILERSNTGRMVFWSDDLLAQAALQSTPPDKTILVARDFSDYTTQRWLDDGASVVTSTWDDGDVTLTLYDGGQTSFSARIAGVEESARPIDLSDIEARMFAVALVFAAGVDASSIEKALKA